MAWRTKRAQEQEASMSSDDAARLRAARQSASDMMAMFDSALDDMNSMIGSSSSAQSSQPRRGLPVGAFFDEEEDEEDALESKTLGAPTAAPTDSRPKRGLPVGLDFYTLESNGAQESHDDAVESHFDAAEPSGNGEVVAVDDSAAVVNEALPAATASETQESAAVQPDADENGLSSPGAAGYRPSSGSAKTRKERMAVPVSPASSLSPSAVAKPEQKTSSTEEELHKATAALAKPPAAKPAEVAAKPDVTATATTEWNPFADMTGAVPPPGSAGMPPRPASATSKQPKQKPPSTKANSSATPSKGGQAPLWNPFEDPALKPFRTGKEMALAEARQKALEASRQFDQVLKEREQEERRQREEQEREQRLRRQQEEEQRRQRLLEEEEARREAAFKRREEARRARLMSQGGHGAVSLTSASDPFAPLPTASTGSRFTQSGQPQGPDTGDQAFTPQEAAEPTPSLKLPASFVLPQQEDEMAAYDSDDDILSVNQALAELAREVRAAYTPVIYAQAVEYDPNDVVERYARIHRAAVRAAVKRDQRLAIKAKANGGEDSMEDDSDGDDLSLSTDEDEADQDLFARFNASQAKEGQSAANKRANRAAQRIQKGMQRIEAQLRILPKVEQRAVAECAGNKDRVTSIKDRAAAVKQVYAQKLQEANERLQRLGFEPRDVQDVVSECVLGADAEAATSVSSASDGEEAEEVTIAHHLTVDDQDDNDNYTVMSAMGLLSKRQDKQAQDEYKIQPPPELQAPVSEGTDVVNQLSSLLEELEEEHADTNVSVDEPMTWTKANGTTFVDFSVNIHTDESDFPSSHGHTRRSMADVLELQKLLQERGADVAFTIDSSDKLSTEDTMDKMAAFLKFVANDDLLKHEKLVHTFFFEEEAAFTDASLPDKFSTDLTNMDRTTLASLPTSHLQAIAAATSTSTRGCVTRFEYADRILAKLAGKNEEEAVPLDDVLDTKGGGFRGIKRAQEDFFDRLATRRATVSESSRPSKQQNEQKAKLPKRPSRSASVKSSGSRKSVSEARKPEPQEDVEIPVTVKAYLDRLDRSRLLSGFRDSGYDDLRTVASLKASDLEALGLGQSDIDLLLKAGIQWQVKAQECGLLSHWQRDILKANEDGMLVLTAEERSHDLRGRRRSGPPSGASSRRSSTGAAYRIEGNFIVDAHGNIDLKAGDEEIDINHFADVSDWDPSSVLKTLYDLSSTRKVTEGSATDDMLGPNVQASDSKAVVRMEGYLDKLPKGVKKAGLLSRWQKRYFKACDGELFYYQDEESDNPSGFLRLRGASVRFKGGTLLEISDPRRSKNLILKAETPGELERWKAALDDECSALKVSRRPRTNEQIQELRNTVIFDIGSCSIRAGFAAENDAAFPSLYMPTVAGFQQDDATVFRLGAEALTPSARAKSNIIHPLRTDDGIGDTYDLDVLDRIYGRLFDTLQIDPSEKTVILTEPQFLSSSDRVRLAEIMFESYGVPAMFMKQQQLLSMYSYGATSGVIVDIGDRMDIVPVDQGFILEQGASKLRLGGRKVTESLTRLMAQAGHRFFSPVESYIGRLVKERLAYVALDFDEAKREEEAGKAPVANIDVRRFAVPDGSKVFSLSGQRFNCTEGLFEPNLWGKDNPGLHDLVHKAIMAASLDMRKTMSRNIFLSGGSTLLPGIAERLTRELQFMLPASCAVKVHAAPHRLHAAFRGASVLAGLPSFPNFCVWHDDWNEVGPDVVRKWADETSVGQMVDSDDDTEGTGDWGSLGGSHASLNRYGDSTDEDDDETDEAGFARVDIGDNGVQGTVVLDDGGQEDMV